MRCNHDVFKTNVFMPALLVDVIGSAALRSAFGFVAGDPADTDRSSSRRFLPCAISAYTMT